jgi:hypothetical protein
MAASDWLQGKRPCLVAADINEMAVASFAK